MGVAVVDVDVAGIIVGVVVSVNDIGGFCVVVGGVAGVVVVTVDGAAVSVIIVSDVVVVHGDRGVHDVVGVVANC